MARPLTLLLGVCEGSLSFVFQCDPTKSVHRGQYFSNVDCSSIGALTYEKTALTNSKATLTVAASEALLLYL
jgi:hypothetical protein